MRDFVKLRKDATYVFKINTALKNINSWDSMTYAKIELKKLNFKMQYVRSAI